ncbi:MAG: hypothetical protein IKG72_07570 [Bacillus sp. (in: Bacteria)]|nr:hypothetical protein [Bacillus sp. (in: firmicutes)]
MLIDVLSSALDTMQKDSELQKNLQTISDFEQKSSKARDALDEMMVLVETGDAAQATGIAPKCGMSEEDINDLAGALQQLSDELDSGMIGNDTMSKLQSTLRALRKRITDAWKFEMSYKVGNLTQMLGTVRSFTPDPLMTGRITSLLDRGKDILPQNAELVRQYAEVFRTGNQILNSIDTDGPVRLFINKVVAGKATLADIDENIMNWIKKHNLLNKMNVTIYED